MVSIRNILFILSLINFTILFAYYRFAKKDVNSSKLIKTYEFDSITASEESFLKEQRVTNFLDVSFLADLVQNITSYQTDLQKSDISMEDLETQEKLVQMQREQLEAAKNQLDKWERLIQTKKVEFEQKKAVLEDLEDIQRDINGESEKGFQVVTQEDEEGDEKDKISTYINPLRAVGAYPEIGMEYFGPERSDKPAYDNSIYGLFNEEDYCERVDRYNLEHPEGLLEKKNFFTDATLKSMQRKKIAEFGNNTMNIDPEQQYYLDIHINVFHLLYKKFHVHSKIGQNFLCATQMYNHIPGDTAFFRKDLIIENINAYADKYKSRPQCFNKEALIPDSYRLSNEQECKTFFELINSENYRESLINEPIQHLIKVASSLDKSEGVFLLTEQKLEELNGKFKQSLECGNLNEALVAQKYISNPLLLELNNKFDFRVFVLITSTNPLIAYYHDGYLRVSINEYDINSQDLATHITKTSLVEKKIKEAKEQKNKINGMTAKQLRSYHTWSFEELRDFLLESGQINDLYWLDSYLRPLVQKALIHLIRMSSGAFWKQSNVYELYGVDFMLDSNHGLWFIENNPNPSLEGLNDEFMGQMILDLYEIQFAYYRSRMKRLLNLIKQIELEGDKKGRIDYEEWAQEYKAASENRLEAEYKIGDGNGFTLIMDESLPKEQAYFNHIPYECIE